MSGGREGRVRVWGWAAAVLAGWAGCSVDDRRPEVVGAADEVVAPAAPAPTAANDAGVTDAAVGPLTDAAIDSGSAARAGACPASTDCVVYAAAPEAGRCQELGACRDAAAADCLETLTPEGTPCGDDRGVCNGRGACEVSGALALGESCERSEECAEGHCVVGATGTRLCCNAACDGVCEQCSATGLCDETPLADDACAPVACPEDSACRDYGGDLDGSRCRGFGQCQAASDCAFVELRPPEQCACEPDGACRLVAGAPCSSDDDCSSGACESSEFNGDVCCDSACPGLQCRGNGEGCVECEGTGVECILSTLARCQNNFLQITSCDNGCGEAQGGAACNPLQVRGATCSATSQCEAGLQCDTDVEGVRRCCDPGCSTTGRTCGGDGTCQCPEGQVFGGTRCGVDEGGQCVTAGDCLGNLPCTSFYLDLDFDGYGSEERRVCGTALPPDVTLEGVRGPVDVSYVPLGGDCCDLFGEFRGTANTSTPSEVNPGVVVGSSRGASACPEPYDFNCDGVVAVVTPESLVTVPNSCGVNCDGGGLVSVSSTTCPGTFSVLGCALSSIGGCIAVGNGGFMACL